MGKFLYLMTLLASLDQTYKDAGDNSRRALMETSMMKEEMKVLEKQADQTLRRLGVDKEDLVYGAYVYPLFSGKASTKPFKGFKYETKEHWTFRPEIEYGLWDKQTTFYLGVIKEF